MDVIHANFGVVLAMTLCSSIALASLHLEDADLGRTTLRDDRTRDLGTIDLGRSNLKVALASDHEDIVQRNAGAYLTRKFLDA